MKAEDDRLITFGSFWLDEKTGQLLRIESGYVTYSEKLRSAIYRDKDGDRRKKYVDLMYIANQPLGVRFRVSVTELRERFKPMGTNPTWVKKEKRWAPTGEVYSATTETRKYPRSTYPR